MFEVHGLLALRYMVFYESLAAQGVERRCQKLGVASLVAVGTGCVLLLYLMYSLFVGNCRKAPRQYSFAS